MSVPRVQLLANYDRYCSAETGKYIMAALGQILSCSKGDINTFVVVRSFKMHPLQRPLSQIIVTKMNLRYQKPKIEHR
jgi:hypothetical protein